MARTMSGPAIWPAAKAAVIRARSGVGSSGRASRASCSPAMVATMNVPPTNTAEAAMAGSVCTNRGRAVPSAITACASAQIRRREPRAAKRATAATERAAARPNSGHVSPNTSGSGARARAMAGRNVAGTM